MTKSCELAIQQNMKWSAGSVPKLSTIYTPGNSGAGGLWPKIHALISRRSTYRNRNQSMPWHKWRQLDTKDGKKNHNSKWRIVAKCLILLYLDHSASMRKKYVWPSTKGDAFPLSFWMVSLGLILGVNGTYWKFLGGVQVQVRVYGVVPRYRIKGSQGWWCTSGPHSTNLQTIFIRKIMTFSSISEHKLPPMQKQWTAQHPPKVIPEFCQATTCSAYRSFCPYHPCLWRLAFQQHRQKITFGVFVEAKQVARFV